MIDPMDISFAPGCFGSALAFKAGSAECSTCPFVALCQPKAEASYAAIQAKFGILAKPKREPKPAAVAPDGVSQPKGPSLRLQKLANKLSSADLKVWLARGEVPFKRPEYLRLICLLLTKHPAGIASATLKEVLMKKLNQSEGVALANLRLARQFLLACALIEDVRDVMKLRSLA